jgi:hypothetical protein
MSFCRSWNEKEADDKTWTNSKIIFAAAHWQRKQMQGKSAANYGYRDMWVKLKIRWMITPLEN